jgi:hypothetical protein
MGFSMSVPGEMPNEVAGNLALVYLFLSVDHQLTDKEMKVFAGIGCNYPGWDDAKKNIIKTYEEILEGLQGNNRYQKVKETFTETEFSDFCFGIERKEAKTERFLLSQFVSLMYEDGIYSEQKFELVKLWVNKYNIDQSILDEMQDIAETLAILQKQKDWVSARGDSFADTPAVLSEITKNMEETEESIRDLIVLG